MKRAHYIWLLLLLLVAFAGMQQARAGERIWSGVIIASHAEKPKAAPAELEKFAPRLTKIFGYNQFELFSSAAKSLDGQSERWLVPSQNFYLGLNAQREKDSHFLLDLEFFHDKRRVLQSKARLGPSSPLFIRGPLHERGQILVVIQILP